MAQGRRGWFLSVVAVLYALLAISNFLKPVMANAHTGFVFFGHRLSGLPNDILGPLFGIFLLALAILIWRMLRLAVPVAWAYAAYVAANGILFSIVERARSRSVQWREKRIWNADSGDFLYDSRNRRATGCGHGSHAPAHRAGVKADETTSERFASSSGFNSRPAKATRVSRFPFATS